MSFNYSRRNLTKKQMILQRIFEILPGSVSWLLILGLFVVTLWQPVISSILVIVFMLGWVLRLFYYWIFLMLSYGRLTYEKKTDWVARVKGLDHFEEYWREISQKKKTRGLAAKLSFWSLRRDLEKIKKNKIPLPASCDIRHLVIIPVIKESQEVVCIGRKLSICKTNCCRDRS